MNIEGRIADGGKTVGLRLRPAQKCVKAHFFQIYNLKFKINEAAWSASAGRLSLENASDNAFSKPAVLRQDAAKLL